MSSLQSLAPYAQSLVETVSSLFGGRTVNIMDSSGVIIASSEKDRIGSLHEGAQEVARTGESLFITPEGTKRYKGTKEGYNMPLTNKGVVVGVVGIFGKPEEVKDLGNLLQIYVSKLFDFESEMDRKLERREMREKLIRLLISYSGTDEDNEMIAALSSSLPFKLEFPLYIHRFSQQGNTSDEDAEHSLSASANGMVTMLSTKKRAISEENEKSYDSRPAANLEDIKDAYGEISFLEKCSNINRFDLSMPKQRCRYMLLREAVSEKAYLKPYVEKVLASIKPNELNDYLLSFLYYIEEDKSLEKASKQCKCHKNTLQYRIKRLMGSIGTEAESRFPSEHIMLLISLYLLYAKKAERKSIS